MEMKQTFIALRYLTSLLAVNLAFALVCFAQKASGGQSQSSQPSAPAAAAKEWPADPIGMLAAEWTRAKNWTKEYIDKMPAEGLSFKPTPEIRSFNEQMLHLASANFFYATSGTAQPSPYKREDFTADKFKTKADLMKMVMESYDFMINGIKGMSPAKLEEKVQGRRVTMTRRATLNNGFEHQTHHRGQTTIYLRLKGVTPPPEPFE
jgi:uncharacterized damage-inducible protein DinB